MIATPRGGQLRWEVWVLYRAEHPEVPLLALSCTLLIMFCGVVDGSCSLLTERSMDFVAGLYETA